MDIRLRCHRFVHNQTLKIKARLNVISNQARNGGHLAAHVATGYSRFCQLYGPEEAKRCFEIEQHTASTIVSIIKENGWEKDVDLVEGGRNHLFLSEQELLDQKSDWEKSGKSDDSGQWFTAEETEEVSGDWLTKSAALTC